MKLGQFEIEQLSEGHYLFGSNGYIERWRPSSKDETGHDYDHSYFKLVGIDPIVVKHAEGYVLLDAGLGLSMNAKERDPHFSNLHTNLDVLDIKADEVTHVILSHLHSDHAGGLTYDNNESASTPTLPNARIIVQQDEWDHALEQYENPTGLEGVGYELDDFFRLVGDGRVEFIEDEYLEIVPGIEVIKTGGHTPGHQIVRITSGKQKAYFFGDLIPGNSKLLHVYNTKRIDFDPVRARYLRSFWLKQAYEEDAWAFFYHAPYKKFGKLSRDRMRRFVLKAEQ